MSKRAFSRPISHDYRRNGRNRSRSPSAASGSSVDESRKPCVFYFSRDAKGCKWTPRECKFSHEQEDYDYWERKGTDRRKYDGFWQKFWQKCLVENSISFRNNFWRNLSSTFVSYRFVTSCLSGRTLPNTGLIFRTSPVNSRKNSRRSYSPRRWNVFSSSSSPKLHRMCFTFFDCFSDFNRDGDMLPLPGVRK